MKKDSVFTERKWQRKHSCLCVVAHVWSNFVSLTLKKKKRKKGKEKNK